jgi:D-alanyl-D-alanine dipeptidase
VTKPAVETAASGERDFASPSVDSESSPPVAAPIDPELLLDNRTPAAGLVDLRETLKPFSPRFEIHYAAESNFTGAPLPGYERAGAWLRAGAAGALTEAAAALHDSGYGLVIFDAYRPRRASVAMAAWARANGHADWLDGWIAARSQHNRGVAIDLGLYDLATGSSVDLGTEFDAFVAASHHSAVHAEEVASRRSALRSAMEGAGFNAYWREWWHYSVEDPDARSLDVAY